MPRRLPALLLLLVLPPLLAGTAVAEGPTPLKVRMLVEGTSPPFSFRDQQNRPAGFVIELIRAIATDQELVVDPDLRPWQEIYPEFLEGKGDLLGLVAQSNERARHMDFSVPFETMHCAFYVTAAVGAGSIRDPGQLAGKRIGVIKDSVVDEFARRQAWPARIIAYPSLAESLAATQRGEIDATLSMQFVTDYMIRSRKLDHLIRAGFVPPGLSYRLAFAVQPGQKQLLARINEGLANVRRRGTYDRLYEKWLGPLEARRLRWGDVQYYLLPLTFLAVIALGGLLWQRKLLRQLAQQTNALRESEERLQLVFEGSKDGFWDWDVAGDRIMRSPHWTDMLGYAPEEVAPTRDSFQSLIHPDDRANIAENERRLWEGEDRFGIEFRMQAKSGAWKWVLDRGKVVARDPATGTPLRITGTHTDITARRLAEEAAAKLQRKMQEAQKLESLGVLAGGIAHDFNNLLTVILGNSSLVRLEPGLSATSHDRLDSVVTAADRAAELCRQLLAYAGKGNFHVERISLNDVITDTTRLLELSLSKQAGLEFDLAPVLPRIEADASQIRQVIMNLVINASEAVAGNPGIIRLSTHVVTLPLPGGGTPVGDLAPGNYVCLAVADTGCGMSPEVVARIFDPFFSTKFTGRGLGLAAVLGIVRTHRGALKVQSTPGQGSCFEIFLPVSATGSTQPFAGQPGPLVV